MKQRKLEVETLDISQTSKWWEKMMHEFIAYTLVD